MTYKKGGVEEYMKNCRDFQNDAILRHYGELSTSDEVRLLDHLDQCSICSAYVKKMERTLFLVNEGRGAAPVSPGFWQAYRAGLRERTDNRDKVLWWKVPVLAAVFSVLLFLGIWFLYPNNMEERPKIHDLPGSTEDVQLVRNLDLLQDYDLIKNLDIIEQIQDASQGFEPSVYMWA